MIVFSSSFDIAVKQAMSIDCRSQDALLREAQKLCAVRGHDNVVALQGITMERAKEDGLSRKYELIEYINIYLPFAYIL